MVPRKRDRLKGTQRRLSGNKAQSLVLCAVVLTTVSIFGCFLTGCATKPDHVKTIKSPTDGFYYTVETYLAKGGPPSPGDTLVYANLHRDGQSARRLVLEGEDLTVARIVWDGPYEATICMGGGYTNTFRNEVTLDLGDSASENVYTHLDESCATDSVPASKQ
jgi:hypothetical protein